MWPSTFLETPGMQAGGQGPEQHLFTPGVSDAGKPVGLTAVPGGPG